MSLKRSLLLGVALVAALAPASASSAPQRIGAQVRYWAFTGGNDLRDVLVYWASRPLHVQLEQWDFVHGQDQFRPEVGWHLADRRRSSYMLQWRHERDRERFTLATEQTLARGFVARADVSPIVGRDRTEWVESAGLDAYWGSYHFAQATVIRDPRDGGLWVFPARVRLATERNDWVQLTIAPASRRTVGWAADARVRWLRVGVERNSRYDFTRLNNVITTLGFEVPLP